MSKPRSSNIDIKYNGKNITGKISPLVDNFSYTDVASGESDSITIELCNIDKRWMGAWLPSKGDKIVAKILMQNWKEKEKNNKFVCGDFVLDEYSFSGRPLTATLSAVSLPQDEAFNATKRTKIWEKVTLFEIAKSIATKASLKIEYDADKIPIALCEQNNQTDCNFLYELCKDYGLAMKVYGNKICIFDEEKYEGKKAVATIDESEVSSDWSYTTTLAGTYTGAKVSYSNPGNSKDIIVNIGSGKRIYECNISADNYADAERKGTALVNHENKSMTTMSLSIMANSNIVASSTVNLTGFEKLNGKYYVDKVRHNISSSGYIMSLSLRLVTTRIKSNAAKVVKKAIDSNKSSASSKTVRVIGNDTIRHIREEMY